jgi:hypothetical protein
MNNPLYFKDRNELCLIKDRIQIREYFEFTLKGFPECKIAPYSPLSDICNIMFQAANQLIIFHKDKYAMAIPELSYMPHSGELKIKIGYMPLEEFENYRQKDDSAAT